MISRDVVKAEIDQLDAANVELLYKIIKAMRTPTEVVAQYPVADRVDDQIDVPAAWPEPLRRRQAALVQQAQQLRKQLGDPVAALADQLRDLPPADDEFWQQVLEVNA